MDHPLIMGAVDLLLAGELGNASFLVDPALPARSVLLEALYVVECVADVRLDTPRFLPATPLVVCVDSRLAPRDYAPSAQSLARARERTFDASRYRRHLGQLVPPMLEAADVLAAEHAGGVIDDAMAQARSALDARLQRLRALAAVNASITQEETAAAASARERTLSALTRARPRLDAVRMAVSPDFLALR
jgi:ATP-dependent helicase HepA